MSLTAYYTYILRCSDGSLYTGITTDLKRRFIEHKSHNCSGAKYTSAHPPLKYEAAWLSENRVLASKLEYRIKRLKKAEKEQLISGSTVKNLDTSGYIKITTTHEGELIM